MWERRLPWPRRPSVAVWRRERRFLPPPSCRAQTRSRCSRQVDAEDLQLAIRLREVELLTHTCEMELMHLRLRAMAMDTHPVALRPPGAPSTPYFDLNNQIALVRSFCESEADSYFNAFEHIASTLNWSRSVWSLLLQLPKCRRCVPACLLMTV